MKASTRLARSTRCCALALAALHFAAPGAHPQRPAPPPRLPLTTTTAAAAVPTALRSVLSQPAVATAARTEILRQLRTNFPLAIIGGVWATPIDMKAVLAVPAVRTALTTKLGGNAGVALDASIVEPGRIAVAFTSQQLGSLLMGDMAKDVMASLGLDAMKGKLADLVGIDDVVFFGILAGAAWYAGIATREWYDYEDVADFDPNTYDPHADPDGDDEESGLDNNDDGDCCPDEEDYFPDDPNRSICDCSGRGGIFFGRRHTKGTVSTLFAALDLVKAQLRTAISLGPVGAGQAAAIRVVIP